MNSLALLSLLFLVAVLVLGFWKKVNMGFLAMGMALIIARIGGIPDKTVISNFSTSLFISLVGPAFLFSMAVNNGTMDLLAKKMLRMVGKNTWCIPLLLSAMTFLLAAAGCGNIPTFSIILPLGIALAVELGIDVIAMGLIITMACNLGCMSPIANGGIIAAGLIAETPYAGQFSWSLFAECALVWLVLTLGFFFLYKLYKPGTEQLAMLDDVRPFDRNQKMTLLACLAVVVVVFAFGVNIGLAAPLAAIILCIFGVASDKAAIKIMPWGTFILVCGVNMLMAVVKALGGIDLLVEGLTSIMSAHHRPGVRRYELVQLHHGRGDARADPHHHRHPGAVPRRWVRTVNHQHHHHLLPGRVQPRLHRRRRHHGPVRHLHQGQGRPGYQQAVRSVIFDLHRQRAGKRSVCLCWGLQYFPVLTFVVHADKFIV